jgi:hypothetical protein
MREIDVSKHPAVLVPGANGFVGMLEVRDRRKNAPAMEFGEESQHRLPGRLARICGFAKQRITQRRALRRGSEHAECEACGK